MSRFKLCTFPNGLRLLLVPSHEATSFQISVLVNTGSDFENQSNNGISHFLEHLCFKGTKKRPTNFDLTKELDEVGGSYNAFTSEEATGYFAKVAAADQVLALDLVSDIYLNSQFPPLEIEKERGVIIEEINLFHDLPQNHVWDLWNKLLYGNQPAARPILGTKENVKKFQREDLIRYRNSQYRAASTLIVASGKFQPLCLKREVKDAFSGILRGKASKKNKTKERQNKPQVILEKRKTEQTHLILGVRSFSLFDKRRYALDVLDAILDGGMSGILFQTVRDKLGAAYYVQSVTSFNTDRGFWVVKAGITNERVEEIIKVILKEWQKFKFQPISLLDLKKAKHYLKGKVSLSLENVHDLASDLAYQELLKKQIETPQEYLAKINQVSVRDVQLVAQSLLQPQRLNLALIGPFSNKNIFNKILSF